MNTIAAVLLALSAQDPPAEGSACPFHAGVRLSLWLGDYDFESRSTTEEVEFDSLAVPMAEIYGVLALDKTWALELGLEASLSPHATAFNAALSGRYAFELLSDPWNTYAKAGLLLGSFDLDDAPGDFEAGIGVQGGLGADYALSTSLILNLEFKLRYLEYEFDEDPNFVKTDGSVGGFSAGLSAGLALRF